MYNKIFLTFVIILTLFSCKTIIKIDDGFRQYTEILNLINNFIINFNSDNINDQYNNIEITIFPDSDDIYNKINEKYGMSADFKVDDNLKLIKKLKTDFKKIIGYTILKYENPLESSIYDFYITRSPRDINEATRLYIYQYEDIISHVNGIYYLSIEIISENNYKTKILFSFDCKNKIYETSSISIINDGLYFKYNDKYKL
jgi:hypothetical protein